MEFTEYQKIQIVSLIFLSQEIAEKKGATNLNYLNEEQIENLLPIFEIYQSTPLDQQIVSIRDIANQLYNSLTSNEVLPTRPEVSD